MPTIMSNAHDARSRLRTPRTFWLLLPALIVLLAGTAGAQVGSSTDIISGRVLGPDSLPVAGARIEVQSADTRVTKRTSTRADGSFVVLFRDGGGQYQLQAMFLGMSPAKLLVQRRADDDRIVVTIRMTRNPTQLATVDVKGKSAAPQAPAPPSAGSTERNLPPQLLERLPVNAGDLAEVASLAPGVVAVAGTDSSSASFSVAGQSATQNSKTVDGASFLFGGLPQDAVRSTKVVTNAYDVSRGQFTGGQIATTTKSGTNIFSGTANYARRDPNLAYASGPDAAFAQRYSQHTGSAGIGGPILQDRVFYFASAEFDRREDPGTSLFSASDLTLSKLGTARDSVAAFASVLGRLGVPVGDARSVRQSQSQTGMVRLDADVADAHSVMARLDLRHSTLDGIKLSPTAVGKTGGELATTGLGGLAVLTSSVGSLLNEARVSWSREHSEGSPQVLPTGVVTVASVAEDGSRGITNYVFGGNQSLFRNGNSTLAEVGDEMSWLTSDGVHRFKFGGLVNREEARYGATANRYGTFLFNSLGDLAQGRAALFSRTLGVADNMIGSRTGTVYLGDAWRRSASLQIAYGIRLESSRLAGVAGYNPAIEQSFGIRTDNAPLSTRVSPRAGFTYLLGNSIGIPAGVLRGGIGEFRGKLPLQVAAAARNASGDPGEQSQVLCVGEGTPVPRWDLYGSDPSAIPAACGSGAQATLEPTIPGVVALGNDFAAPRVWRASLGGTRLLKRVSVTMESTLLLGKDNPVARDWNLRMPSFLSAGEGRLVFASPDRIVAATGAAPLSASRSNTSYGPVLVANSDLQSRTVQLTGTVAGNLWRRVFGSTSYTYTKSEDQSNGFSLGGYFPTTDGNPNTTHWGTSDLERRHALMSILTIPVRSGLEIGIIARSTSGQRFTPMVNGDANGDGSRNDRAFVPEPGVGADTALANGMTRLLATTDPKSRRCLQAAAGTIAERNACVAPWTTSIDAQITFRPGSERLNQRLSLSLQAINTAAGVDQLLHGTNGLRGWGQTSAPDRNLLLLRGFDAASRRYSYQVNEHFGSRAGGSNAFRTPFQLVLRGKLMLGTDPAANPFASVDGKAPTVEVWKSRIAPQVPNPVTLLLNEGDSLKVRLDPNQRARLTTYNEGLTVQVDAIVTELATILAAAGARPDPGAIAPKLQAKNEALKTLVEEAVKRIRDELTPAQWEQLPERIRLPLAQPQQKPAKPDR